MKWILRLVVVAVLLVALLVGAGLFLVEPAVVAVVEKGGTYALGVDTRLADARIGVLSGDFGLAGLSVDNPPGFEAEHFLDLEQTAVQVEMGSLLGDRIVVPAVLVEGVTLVLERNANGTNYDVLLDHLRSLSSPADESAPPAEEEGDAPTEDEPAPDEASTTLVIEELVLRDIRSEVRLFAIGGERKTIPVVLPEITIRNLGGEDGATVDVVYSQLIEELLNAVVAAGGDQLPQEFLRDLEGELQRLGDAQLDRAEEKAREELNRALEDVDVPPGLEEEADEAIDKARKSVEGLFGGGDR